MSDALPYTKRFGPNHHDGLACIDTLVQDLAIRLRAYHALLSPQLTHEADVLLAVITTLYSALTQRAIDFEDAWLAIRNDDKNSNEFNKWLDEVLAENLSYDKSDLRRHLLDRIRE